LKLVFTDEDSDSEELDLTTDTEGEENGSIALQYEIDRKDRLRIENRIGVRSQKFKASTRVRYKINLSERWRTTLSEEIFWWDGIGFGSQTISDLDYLNNETRLTRWRNRFDYNERSQGVEYLSRLSHRKSFDKDHAIVYFTQVAGDTRPEYQTSRYGLGTTYRQRLFKPWLFSEVEPRYFWVYDELDDRREGIASIVFRLEVVFSEKYKSL
jgi:hypothetical protein